MHLLCGNINNNNRSCFLSICFFFFFPKNSICISGGNVTFRLWRVFVFDCMYSNKNIITLVFEFRVYDDRAFVRNIIEKKKNKLQKYIFFFSTKSDPKTNPPTSRKILRGYENFKIQTIATHEVYTEASNDLQKHKNEFNKKT